MVWAVVIAVLLHIFAYFIYKMGGEVLEAKGFFLGVVGVYLVVYFAAAIGLRYLIPPAGDSNIAALPQAWMDPVFAAE
jgi:hypothetical protein